MVIANPNILWITIDACRKEIFYRLPNARKISTNAIVFENAFANAPWTLPSVASMFTGLYPSQHGALNEKTKLRKGVKTIAEILAEKGYDTIIITQNDGWLTPYYGLTKGFKKFYDIEKMIEEVLKINFPKSKKLKLLIRVFVKYFIGYDVMTRKLLQIVIKRAKKPWFIYLHLMDTHMPYEPKTFPLIAIIRYLVFYKNWKDKMQRTWIGEKSFSGRELKILKTLYIRAMKNVDKQLQEYVRVINDKKTLLIITADHGEELGEQGLFGHQFSFSEALISVPLIVRLPQNAEYEMDFLFETKNLFYFVKDIVEKKMINFCKSDYVFGENREIEEIFKKLKKIKKDLSYPEKFIRTKKLKYIRYSDGKEKLYKIQNKNELLFKNEEIVEMMRALMKIKEREIKKSSLYI